MLNRNEPEIDSGSLAMRSDTIHFNSSQIAFGGKYCTASLRISRQPLLYNLLPEIVAQDPVIEVSKRIIDSASAGKRGYFSFLRSTRVVPIVAKCPFCFLILDFVTTCYQLGVLCCRSTEPFRIRHKNADAALFTVHLFCHHSNKPF